MTNQTLEQVKTEAVILADYQKSLSAQIRQNKTKLASYTTVKSVAKPRGRPASEFGRYGTKSFYKNAWQEEDRSVAQFGFLLSHARTWIMLKETNHVRVSKAEAFKKISELKH